MKHIGALMRKFSFLICLLTTTCASWAQNNQGSWNNLKALQPGQKIQVLETNSTKLSGTFLNATDTALSIEAGTGPQTVQKPEVKSVKLMKNSHRLRNTLIGAGIGAGAGAGITAAAWQPDAFIGGRGVGAAFGAGIGGIGGAVVGVLLPAHDTVYRIP
jgi:Zn-dependent alcohol dehydrogenase